MEFEQLDVDLKQKLDDCIFENKKIRFFLIYQENNSCTLPEALEVLGRRYEYLRKTKPNQFNISHEKYWENFYS